MCRVCLESDSMSELSVECTLVSEVRSVGGMALIVVFVVVLVGIVLAVSVGLM